MAMKIGSKGAAVTALQASLTSAGFTVEADGWFGERTREAVRAFQRSKGLAADGIAGRATLRTLEGCKDDVALSEDDIEAAAHLLDVDAAAIRAVVEVESRGAGFDENSEPVTLFERHVFHRRLPKETAAELAASHPELCSAKRGGYQGGKAEMARIRRAAKLCGDAGIAWESASWGLFQIMGCHWRAMGYASADDFVNAMWKSEGEQLQAFVRFVKINPSIWRALKDRNWKTFARHYNGPAYAENLYDVKLARAYARHERGRS